MGAQAGNSSPQRLTEPHPPLPPILRVHLEITPTHPAQEAAGQLEANSFQQGAGAGAQPGLSSSSFKAAQHSKSLEEPSVSRSWRWQELNVHPHFSLSRALVWTLY